ncbi:MAG: PH domain-containing protein [Acidobacteriota bacterium]|nr:PH domain-containing protein [Acidobacteriota bacterium]
MTSDLQSQIFSIKRPAPELFKYYVLSSFLFGPLFFIPLIYFYFRYHTMQYSFDEEGISMKWGILFRREIMLTYARIQDIHLTSNIVERWLRLARIQIQTASASAAAEMTIEGLHEFELVRDFLYSKMRGVRHVPGSASAPAITAPVASHDLAAALREVSSELRGVREALERRLP